LKEDISPKNEYYTGNISKQLLVHVMQNGVEVDKPIKAKIFDRSVVWNQRHYPVIPSRFMHDYNGLAHQYVDTNDVAVLTWQKDHEDKCKKCGGKMTIDAQQSRALGRRGIFNAIWGLDNTHMIIIILAICASIGASAFAVYELNQDTLHKAQLESAQTAIKQYKLALGIDDEPKDTTNGHDAGGTR